MAGLALGRNLFHAAACLAGVGEPKTQTSAREREALRKYAAGRKRAVEIGVFEGVTTALIASAMKPGGDARLFAVDPFFKGRLGKSWPELIARRQVRRSGAADVVTFVKELSNDACEKLDGEFDFIFIDGDHSLEGITRDWADWSGRIVEGGIIALHDTRVPDYNPAVSMLGSHRYFETHIRHDPRFELLEQVDSLSILRRS